MCACVRVCACVGEWVVVGGKKLSLFSRNLPSLGLPRAFFDEYTRTDTVNAHSGDYFVDCLEGVAFPMITWSNAHIARLGTTRKQVHGEEIFPQNVRNA